MENPTAPRALQISEVRLRTIHSQRPRLTVPNPQMHRPLSHSSEYEVL
jgi:hypothetical protein